MGPIMGRQTNNKKKEKFIRRAKETGDYLQQGWGAKGEKSVGIKE